MKLTKFAIERPVTTTMLFIALAFFGIMAYMNVGVNMMPKVNSHSIMVTIVLPGATPEELEKNVTEKIEKITCYIGKDSDGNDVSVSVGSGTREISFSNPFMTQEMLDNVWKVLSG